MQTVPLDLLAPLPARELATSLVRAATGLPPAAAHSLVLTLDAVSAAVVRSAGMTAAEARPVLGALWQHPARYAELRPAQLLRPDGSARGRESAYRRDLAQRIHVVRHARRLTPTGVRNRTGIEQYVLHDLESGDLWPSAQQLYRLAETFAVPVPLLVDPKATPLRILRLLSGQVA
jgi:hypothetical protein